jgi:hypothetical protein
VNYFQLRGKNGTAPEAALEEESKEPKLNSTRVHQAMGLAIDAEDFHGEGDAQPDLDSLDLLHESEDKPGVDKLPENKDWLQSSSEDDVEDPHGVF